MSASSQPTAAEPSPKAEAKNKAGRRPRLALFWRPFFPSGCGAVCFLAEDREQKLSHPIFRPLIPLLDGNHGLIDIFAELCEHALPDQILAALDELDRRGLLAREAGHTGDGRSEAVFQDGLAFRAGHRPDAIERRPAEWLAAGIFGIESGSILDAEAATIQVESIADLDCAPLRQACSALGLSVRGSDADAEPTDRRLRVVLTDDYLRPELTRIDREQRRRGEPWLLFKPVGVEPWIGPLFDPAAACHHCLAQRLAGHRPLAAALVRMGELPFPQAGPQGFTAASYDFACASAAHGIARWVQGDDSKACSALKEAVVSVDFATLTSRRHPLFRRPQCPSCGRPASRVPDRDLEPIRLQARPKISTKDGGHRAATPAEARRRLEKHLSPITGIVRELRPCRAASRVGGPVVALLAEHAFPSHPEGPEDPFGHRAGGKGRSLEQARLSALAESIERYSGVFMADEPRRRARLADLEGAIDPNACALYSSRQFQTRADDEGGTVSKARWVAAKLEPDAEIDWTPLWSLTHGRRRYLPTAYCYYGYPFAPGEPEIARASSNGCAAGSFLEEAVLQGFLELVERDAVAVWWYNRFQVPGVRLGSGGETYGPRLQEEYRRVLDREIQVLDLTGDLQIPVYGAVSWRRDGGKSGGGDVLLGFGAHLDPQIALGRALTELNQSLEWVPGPHRTTFAGGNPEALRFWTETRIADSPYLRPDDDLPELDLGAVRSAASDDLAVDVRTCVDLAAGLGIEVLVLDQTRPDVGLPVVRVVAPGLRHFWARFAPGRLYDVPVSTGRMSKPLRESELNPHVVYF